MSPQAATIFDHLVVKLSTPQARTSILDEWIWLIGEQKRTFLIAACGDVFVEDACDGTIHFLDVSASTLTPVAETVPSFETLLAEPSFVEHYLRPKLVEALRSKGSRLKRNQIYSFRHPLSLGGQVALENIDMCDVEVHFSITGQVARQLADLPAGAVISSIKIDRMPGKKPWWRFW